MYKWFHVVQICVVQWSIIISLIIMYYVNTKVSINSMKLSTLSKYAILYIWSVLSVSV